MINLLLSVLLSTRNKVVRNAENHWNDVRRLVAQSAIELFVYFSFHREILNNTGIISEILLKLHNIRAIKERCLLILIIIRELWLDSQPPPHFHCQTQMVRLEASHIELRNINRSNLAKTTKTQLDFAAFPVLPAGLAHNEFVPRAAVETIRSE